MGAGRKARLCRLGGVLRSDPEADLSLQEKRHPACYPAGCDLRGHSAGDGPEAFKALLCEALAGARPMALA